MNRLYLDKATRFFQRMQLQNTTDTTSLSYWLNWRVYLCACCVLLPMVLAILAIRKHECSRNFSSCREENQQDTSCTLFGETWKPCLKEIHPICLLVFRVIAFASLLATLIAKLQISRGTVFYYYTQWTFILVTIYFGCASMLSGYGCYQYRKSRSTTLNANLARIDAEQGPSMPLLYQDATNQVADPQVDMHKSRVATIWSYIFQILFQMNAGSVMLTDCVYWFVIFPFLTLRDYDLNFMTVNMHTLNIILLLGDTALNCLRLPWIGISYFVLWTGVYVILQWIIHACISIWWPYPFLDLSSPYAPLWYLFVDCIVAYSMLWHLLADCGNETLFFVKMVPFLLSVLKIE
ncbi:hypothetical protein Lal_00043383 [Lupinus albus]|nr:hypothetical protein Lal_00043383 [Lupinus albus]